MTKPWLQSYPEGVPEEISIDEYATLSDIFDQSSCKNEPLPAFSNFSKTITYKELRQLTSQMGAYLKNELGLAKGAKIAVMMPNLLQNPVAIFGILRAGMVVVNTNPLYTARELKHQMNDSGTEAIIIVENFCHVLEEVIDESPIKHVIVTRLGDMLPFPKSSIINFVVKRIKKMVPAYNLRGAVPFKQALKLGAEHRFETVPTSHLINKSRAFIFS